LEQYTLSNVPQKPSVLAISRETLLRAARLEMPLLNMKRQGLIDDYFITNPTLFDVPDQFAFDVVWVQRGATSRLIEHLEKKIRSRYLLDMDDFLIGKPSYTSNELPDRDVLVNSIQRCSVLTVSSARLARIIQRHIRIPIIQKAMTCPNGFEFPALRRTPEQPKGIILASSDDLGLTESKEPVMRAVADFAKRRQLPLHYFGDQAGAITSWFRNAVCLGRTSYFHYHALLASLPPMIGIAPLETTADQDTLEFISGKSDIKMVDFGGAGHPSVYSSAPPYVDTDLKTGIVADNTIEAWSNGLNSIYENLWKNLDSEQDQVIRLRHMNRIAGERWYNAVVKARLPERMKAAELRFSSKGVMFFIEGAKHFVISQDHLLLNKIAKRMPGPLLRFARKIL
jgi:hypothetical protein